MSVAQLESILDDNNCQNKSIDTERIKRIIDKANELGVTKMYYEHPGQAIWRHRWEFCPYRTTRRSEE